MTEDLRDFEPCLGVNDSLKPVLTVIKDLKKDLSTYAVDKVIKVTAKDDYLTNSVDVAL